MTINWKQKLTSRKFWLALIGFVVALLIVFEVDSLKIEQIIALISAISTLITYIVGESIIDAKRIDNERMIECESKKTDINK